MSLSRRDFGLGLTGALASTAATLGDEARAQTPAPPAHNHDMSAFPPHWTGTEKIAFVIYPQFTALDMVGPHYMLGSLMGATTHIVAKSMAPVVSDMKLSILPTHSFQTCPRDIDIICVPGGAEGTLAAMNDPDTIAFLKDIGGRAKYITSVCTGSLVLGAAGLL
ncbi:MAG: DJ-1/PfpI family protein, partial [Vicinamibacterales bacterium]